MASLKDIRARIESTKNTQQITKAMKLVSAAKLRKAQNSVVNMRPFALSLRRVIADIAITKKISHPLIEVKTEIKRVLLVTMSSDRGLCGAFNSNVIRFTENYLKTHRDQYSAIDLFIIGKKAADYFTKRGTTATRVLTRLDKDISYNLATDVAQQIMQGYLDGDYDEVRIIHNEFKSAISQVVCCETILPIDLSHTNFDVNDLNLGFARDMIYEPSAEAIIDQVIAKHFEMQVYRCMLESVASEHGARMTAMENSTNNAREMIASLTLTYNKLRQEKITTELTEIVSGAEALK